MVRSAKRSSADSLAREALIDERRSLCERSFSSVLRSVDGGLGATLRIRAAFARENARQRWREARLLHGNTAYYSVCRDALPHRPYPDNQLVPCHDPRHDIPSALLLLARPEDRDRPPQWWS